MSGKRTIAEDARLMGLWSSQNSENPESISVGSEKKVWWNCPYHMDREPFLRAVMTVATSNDSLSCGCQNGKRVVLGINDLASQHPTLALEWSSLNEKQPHEYAVTSSDEVWWICTNHPELPYQAKISKRVTRGDKCGCDSGKRVVQGYNDLAFKNPDFLSEWSADNARSPDQVAYTSTKKVLWDCSDHNGTYEESPNGRYRGRNCGCASGRRLIVGFNDLASQFPEIAQEWSPKNSLGAHEVFKSSNKKFYWDCAKCDREFESTVNNRTSRGSGCLCESNSKNAVIPGINDLASQYTEIVDLWSPENGISPDQIAVGSSKKYKWICEHHPEIPYESSVYNVTKLGIRCSCMNKTGRKTTLATVNDFATTNSEIAVYWHPTRNGDRTVEHFTRFSNQRVWWMCALGHEWRRTVSDQNKVRKHLCPVCSGRRLLAGFNDLATTHPEIAAQWHPELNGDLTPEMVTYGSNTRVWWLCETNPAHNWNTPVFNRVRGNGCFTCWKTQQKSRGEQEIADFVTALGFDVISGDRTTITPLELDVYVPEKNFAIEFNGVFWHSELYRDKNYHERKFMACRDVGVQLYQVWDDDWFDRKHVVMRGIAHRLGVTDKLRDVVPEIDELAVQRIGARSLKIDDSLNYREVAGFLHKNHIQGPTGGTFYYGLRDAQERLRAVMVVKTTPESGVFTIERYATAGVVSGGFTRLLKHAERSIPGLRQWITFADHSVSDGGLYEAHGFVVDRVLPPDYAYLVDGRRVHKFNYRLKRFKHDPSLNFVEGATERELAALNGLIQVWDSGKIRYVKNL